MSSGQEIVAEAFSAYGEWLWEYSDYLECLSEPDKAEVYRFWCEVGDIDMALAMLKVEHADQT